MSTNITNSSESQEVTFHDEHRPFLDEGTYQVTFHQNITGKQVISEKINDKKKTVPDVEKSFNMALTPQEIDFNVAGPRFQMPPSIVHAVHPPAGGQGNYMSHLPKLTLKRSTLPWERSPKESGTSDTISASWLFLLLVDETEEGHIKELNGVKLEGNGKQASLKNNAGSEVGTIDKLGGDIALHPHPFNALSVDTQWVGNLIPATLEELQYLSFASTKSGEHEHGVILSNRLPLPGNNSTVYLISLENNYDSGAFSGKTLNGKYFFPYFYKWTFHTNVDYLVTEAISNEVKKKYPHEKSLDPIVDQLFTSWKAFEQNPVANSLPKEATALIKQKAKLPGVTFHGLLHNLTAGFKAFNLADGSSGLTSIGTIHMPFEQIAPQTSENAYYHGPFVAAKIKMPNTIGLPIKGAAEWNMQLKATDLYLTNSGTHQIDISYGAAMELGRLTALNNVSFAETFISWKKQAAVALYQDGSTQAHLSFYTNAQYNANIPDHIRQQFDDWKQLKGIPYQYLIPDPDLLPLESLRYFYLDTNWINAFLYGAFSIGHTILPKLLKPKLNELLMDNNTEHQGFLLNSFAVSGWPDYEVKAFHKSGKKEVQIASADLFIRQKNLSKNIVMQVYKQPFDQLQFGLHHSKNHSGFLYENDKYEKQGHDISRMKLTHQTIVNVSQLAADLGAKGNVSAFAAAMLEGTPYVQFNIN